MTSSPKATQALHILQVEDNPNDVALTREALSETRWRPKLHVVDSVPDAMAFLRQEPPHEQAPRPNLVLLDLNLPGSPGHELLAIMKDDANLRTIPVVILTSSKNPEDIKDAYSMHANAFLSKPMHFAEFARTLEVMMDYWFEIVTLPE